MERFTGDIFACQRELNDLVKRKMSVNSGIVDDLSLMISKFASDSFIPIEYSEKLLTSVGNLMEKCTDDGSYSLFAANAQFLGTLIDIVVDFDARLSLTLTASQSISPSSFSSHRCYELTLFMLLGLLDKTPLLKVFVKALNPTVTNNLMKSAASILFRDHLYLTQEVALEIICRLCHYFAQQDRASMQQVTAGIAPEVLNAVRNPAAIPALLRDMRPLLNTFNAQNPNVFSFPVRAFKVGTNWKSVDTQRSLHDHGWLDLCKGDVCYNLLDDEVLIRFSYQGIKKINFAEDNHCVQIQLHSCPKKLKELLKKDEVPPAGNCPVLLFELDIFAHPKALEEMRAVAEMRMIEHETVKLDGRKYSVVSSKDQSPDAVSKALDLLHRQAQGQAQQDQHAPGQQAQQGQQGFQAVVSPSTAAHSSHHTDHRNDNSDGKKEGASRGYQSNAGPAIKSAQKNSAAKKGKNAAGGAKKAEPAENTPSSISSPDMEGNTSVSSSQERLPHHKQAPDTLVQLAAKQPGGKTGATGAGTKPSTAGAGAGAEGGERSRTRGADSLSMLHRPAATAKATAVATKPTASISKMNGKAAAPRPFDHDEEVEVKFPDRRSSSSTKGKGKQNPAQKTPQKKQPLPVSAGKPKPTAATKLTTTSATKTTAGASASTSAAKSKAKSNAGAALDEKPLSWVESLGLQQTDHQQDLDVTAGAGEDFGFEDVYPEHGREGDDGGFDGGGGFDNDFMDTEDPPTPPVQEEELEGNGEHDKAPPPRGEHRTERSAKKDKDKTLASAAAPESAPPAVAGKTVSGFAKFKGALQPLTSSALNARNSTSSAKNTVSSPMAKTAVAAAAPKSAAKMRIGPSVAAHVPAPVSTVGAAATHAKLTKPSTKGKSASKAAVLEKENAPLEEAPQLSQESSALRRFPLSPAVSIAASHAASNADARSTSSKRKFGHAFRPVSDAADREVLSGMEWLATDDDSSSNGRDRNKENRTNRKRGRPKEDSVQKKGKAGASIASVTKTDAVPVSSAARMRRESTSSEKQRKDSEPAAPAVPAAPVVYGRSSSSGGKPPTRPPRPSTSTSNKPVSKAVLAMEPTNRALFPPPTRRNADPLTAALTTLPPLLLPQELGQRGIAAPLLQPASAASSDIDMAEAPAVRSVLEGRGGREGEMQEMGDDFGGFGADDFGGRGDEGDFHAGAFDDHGDTPIPLRDAAACPPSHAIHKAAPFRPAPPDTAHGSRSVTAVPQVAGTKHQQVVPSVGLTSWRTKPAPVPVSSTVSASAATSASATLHHNAQDAYASAVADDADAKVGSKRPLSSIGAKLAASRADLHLAVSSSAAAAKATVHQQDQDQGQDQENHQPNITGSLHVPSFTQTLKAASQLSASSYASQPASPHSATSTAHVSHRPLQEVDDGPLFKKQKPVPSKQYKQQTGQHQRRGRGRYKGGIADAESDSDGQEEEEVDLAAQLGRVQDKYGSGSPGSNVSGSGSSIEEQGVIAALLAEIVNMQKQRAQRKRARMLANVGTAAKAQVFSFLDQWRAFAEHASSEAQRSFSTQLQHLCAAADTLCDSLGADAAACLQRDAKMAETLRVLDKETTALKSEVSAALAQYRVEDSQVRNELLAVKNRTLDTARKTVAMQKDLRQGASKHQSKELLNALKHM